MIANIFLPPHFPTERNLTVRTTSGVNKTWLLRPWDRVNQTTARTFCRQRGGELLTITRGNDTAVLLKQLQQYRAIDVDPAVAWDLFLWIGLVAQPGASTSNKTAWSFISTGKTPTNKEDNWWKGEPYDSFYCSQLDGADGVWVSWHCNRPDAGYVCQLGCSAVGLQSSNTSAWPIESCDGAAYGSNCKASCVPAVADATAPTMTCASNGTWVNLQGSCSSGAPARLQPCLSIVTLHHS